MNETRTLYCENGCGHSLQAAQMNLSDAEIEYLTIKAICPICEEMVKYIEDLTIQTTFKCTSCGQKKTASHRPTREQAKAIHPCGECERKTEWHETGWEEISVT